MKTRINLRKTGFPGLMGQMAALLLASLAATFAGDMSVELGLERSGDLETWESVELTPEMITEKGGLTLDGLPNPVFFRLDVSGAAGPVPAPEGMVFVDGPFPVYMAKNEVTWAEWQTVRAWGVANGYTWSGPDHNESEPSGCAANHPVHSVSWYDAVKWCNARSEMANLTPAYRVDGEVYRTGDFGTYGSDIVEWNIAADGYRLPTEMEWTFAAWGGLDPDYLLYSGSNNLDEVGWYWENSGNALCNMWEDTGKGTHPVGQKMPNSLGLYDMSGNVGEWCWDQMHPLHTRIFKGGSWFGPEEPCRVAFVGEWSPNMRIFNLGFRVVRWVAPPF